MIWKVKLRQLSPVLQKVVAGDGYLCQETMERTVHLTAGLHPIAIGFYEGGGGLGLGATYSGPDTGDVQIALTNAWQSIALSNVSVADATQKNRWVAITHDGKSCKQPSWVLVKEGSSR